MKSLSSENWQFSVAPAGRFIRADFGLRTAFVLLAFVVMLPPALKAVSDEYPASPRHHSVTVTESKHVYRFQMGGAIDGVRTRSPIGTKPWTQKFEPMRSVRLENTGDVDVINPWLTVNGRRNWRTVDDIVEEALRTFGNPAAMSEAEKARALYEFVRRHRFHATTGDLDVQDPVKMFNIYGYTLCGDTAPLLMDLWRLAGLNVRRGFLTGHCVADVWFDGAWHMLDADGNVFYLNRDNRTIASEREVVRDHDLIKRTHAYGGVNYPDSRRNAESTAALYVFEGRVRGQYGSHMNHSMAMRLRPGESIGWRWDHRGKHHYLDKPYADLWGEKTLNLRETWGDAAWALVANGRWTYQPPLKELAGRRGVSAANIVWSSRPNEPAARPKHPGETASLIWEMAAPYVIVGGALEATFQREPLDRVEFFLSFDQKEWRQVSLNGKEGQIIADLDPFFPNNGAARYRYWLRLDMGGDSDKDVVGLGALRVENDLQMAPLSLPALEVGENTIRYTDETDAAHSVEITFDWVESSVSRPPVAPLASLFPADGQGVKGTQFTFRWREAEDPDGEAVADYHFQLSADPEMRWIFSSNFDKLISNTSNRGSAAYTIPYPGLLNPDQRYYWRVRAQDEKGIWSDWSAVWSFTAQAPGVPLRVELREKGDGSHRLAWEANSEGRRLASYRIYASNEKGFSVSDESYQAYVGTQHRTNQMVTFPANFLTETSDTALELNPRHAYYRVVAVDAEGVRSGPSDFAESPRPLIYTSPPLTAIVGKEFRYQALSIRSIGDLKCKIQHDDLYHDTYCETAFWDRDQVHYSMVDESPICGYLDPDWLQVDSGSGLVFGTPEQEDIGEYQVNLLVEIEGAGQELQSFVIQVVADPIVLSHKEKPSPDYA